MYNTDVAMEPEKKSSKNGTAGWWRSYTKVHQKITGMYLT